MLTNRFLLYTRFLVLTFFSFCFAVLTGCAANSNRVAHDPIEPFNRGVYKFNAAVDASVVKPVTTVYKKVTPRFAQKGVRNFFGNLSDAWSTVNSVLQFKGREAGNSFFRVVVNTLFGFGGVIDVATEAQIPKSKQDFGLTLRRWGVPAGPYLVLPFLGPSTLRDAIALPVDIRGHPVFYITPNTARYSLAGLNLISKNADLDDAATLLKQSGMDSYIFVRDAYLNTRGVNVPPSGNIDAFTEDDFSELDNDDNDTSNSKNQDKPSDKNTTQRNN